MSEFKGTKGEWKREGTVIFVPGGGFDVRHMPDAEENAKLIAVAPNLLLCLQQIVSSAHRLGFVSNDDSGLSLEVSKAEFYIDKALGK